jgi:FtsZ-binding cell division protein ZapB
MDRCLEVLEKLVWASRHAIEDMEALGLEGEGYWEDMNEVRKATAKAEEVFKEKYSA